MDNGEQVNFLLKNVINISLEFNQFANDVIYGKPP